MDEEREEPAPALHNKESTAAATAATHSERAEEGAAQEGAV